MEELKQASLSWSVHADRNPQGPCAALLAHAAEAATPVGRPLYRGCVMHRGEYRQVAKDRTYVLPMSSWSPRVDVAAEFTWDQSLDEDDPTLISTLLVWNDPVATKLPYSLLPTQDEYLAAGEWHVAELALGVEGVDLLITL